MSKYKKKPKTLTIDGLKYISLGEAADLLGMRNDAFGKTLKELISNGLRVFNTSRNNKGIKICKQDLMAMRDKAVRLQVPITDIVLK